MLKDMVEANNDKSVERVSDGVYVCDPGFVARVCVTYGYGVAGVMYGTCDNWEQARAFAGLAVDHSKAHDVILVSRVKEKYPGELGIYIGEKDSPEYSFSVIEVSKEAEA